MWLYLLFNRPGRRERVPIIGFSMVQCQMGRSRSKIAGVLAWLWSLHVRVSQAHLSSGGRCEMAALDSRRYMLILDYE